MNSAPLQDCKLFDKINTFYLKYKFKTTPTNTDKKMLKIILDLLRFIKNNGNINFREFSYLLFSLALSNDININSFSVYLFLNIYATCNISFFSILIDNSGWSTIKNTLASD